tara:strand:+ start:6232 stop:6984 length:753 start_codon:yes stop_codon:yes gene_type:complete
LFDLRKVLKARKKLELITSFLFKLFQLNLRYKEKRKDYGIEIFEYFYLPWRSDEKFKDYYELIKEYTLNPKSRLFTIYDMSKKYLINDTSFVEVGCWRGGVSGLVALENKNKDIDYFICDTFEGVANATEKDTFFKGQEYKNANINDVEEVAKISNQKFNIIQGVFPNSIKKQEFNKPISFAHIDVDTYVSAKESFDFIFSKCINGALIILDDYGGWFTDGVTKFGNELKNNDKCVAIPNHLGQILIYKI